MRHPGIVVQRAVSGFPSLSIVEPKLFRLRLLGRSHRILEWNLSDGHELSLSELGLSGPDRSEPSRSEQGLSVRHKSPLPRCIPVSPGTRRPTSASKLCLFSHLSEDFAHPQIERDLRV